MKQGQFPRRKLPPFNSKCFTYSAACFMFIIQQLFRLLFSFCILMANWYLTTLWLLMHLIKLAVPSLLEQRNPGHNNKAISSPCTGLRPFLLYIENQLYSVLQCERKYRIKPTENLSQVPGTWKVKNLCLSWECAASPPHHLPSVLLGGILLCLQPLSLGKED